MKETWNFFKRQWWYCTHTSYTTKNLTLDEFKKLWNKNLEDMKID